MARQQQVRGLDFRRVPQLQPFVLPNARPTGRRIGGGAYGTVEELDVDGLLCAGKKLHEVLVERANPATPNIVGKFVEECSLLSNLRHPNIVQFIGICFLDTSDIPVLVMEYLPYCLDSLLEDRAAMSLAMKCSVLCDVLQALVCLHARAPPVIHRDLSAKNVLLTSSMMAKVADLGVARILSVQPGRLSLTMTQTPGTLPYMPPEALAENPTYNTAIDMFSFGHLALYTIVQDFPYPSPAVVMDTDNPGVLVARSEVQRRSRQMEQLSQQLGGETHPLVQLVTQCLHNDPRQRPSASQVLSQLQEVKTQLDDPYQDMSKLELIQTLRRREGERGWNELEAQVTHLQGELQAKETELDVSQAEFETREAESRSRLMQVQDELRIREQENELLQEELRIREQEIQEMRAQVRTEDAKTTELTGTTEVAQRTHLSSWSFNWKRGRNLPISQCRGCSVVMLDGKVYIEGGIDEPIHEYWVNSDSWRSINLPTSSLEASTMTTYNQQLIIVGGWIRNHGNLSKIQVWNGTTRRWTTPYPDMPTAQHRPAVVSHQQFLVVAGGSTGHIIYGSGDKGVQVFNRSTMQWVSAPFLPVGCLCPTLTVVGDKLYLHDDSGKMVNVFCISLSALVSLASSTPMAPPPTWEVVDMDSLPYSAVAHVYPLGFPNRWQVPKELHLSSSTFVCLRNRLLVVGGIEDNKPISAICLYNPRTQQKTRIGDLPAVLSQCVCAALPSGDLVVLGGRGESNRASLDVFIASVD